MNVGPSREASAASTARSPRSQRRPQRGGSGGAPLAPRAFLLLAPLCLSAIPAGCGWTPRDPGPSGARSVAFERLPYVQAVDASGGQVLWSLRRPVVDRFRYRLEGESTWHEVTPESADASSVAASAASPARPAERESPDASVRPGAAGSGPDAGAARPQSRPVAGPRRVRLMGLPSASTVEYVVAAGDEEVGPERFRTAPPPGSDGPVRVLAFGDSGAGSRVQLELARLMESSDWDLAVHTGDIAYYGGSEEDFTLRHFGVYSGLLARVPFFPSPGDHDLRTDGGRPYDRAFAWPAPRPDARYYTFRWGDVQFLSLNTTDEDPEGIALRRRHDSPQLVWLVGTLDSIARQPDVRWTVVFMHTPPYSHGSGFGGHGSDPELRRVLPPLFERYGVDLVLAGHDHHYERSWPIRNDRRVPGGCGPVYVVTGGGGAPVLGRSVAPSPLTARISLRHHFLGLTISPDAIEGTALDQRARDFDRFRVLPFRGPSEDGWEERCD